MPDNLIVRAPLFPTNRELGFAIQLFANEPLIRIRKMITAIGEQTGTPQSTVDWSNPDQWITERLSGEAETLAKKIWHGSKGTLNPRHVYGCYLFINRMQLLNKINGTYQLGERGQRFLEGDEELLRELDIQEGIPKVLSLVATLSPSRFGDLIEPWTEYLKAVSAFASESTFKDTLRRRLSHLVDRDLISRRGNTYTISEQGHKWLLGFGKSTDLGSQPVVPTHARMNVLEATKTHNNKELKAFETRLMSLAPIQFEHFVKNLLESMEYEDVQVTRYIGDKGVDVVGRIQVGITSVREVVQVKRTQSTITRPTIDQLRGALPYHNALRGTIISLGSFTPGAQEGANFMNAAPITLIDGKNLMDLCVKHEVGIKRRKFEIYEVDETFFSENFPELELPVDQESGLADADLLEA